MVDIFFDHLRWAAFFIDSALYKLIPFLYKLIIYLANINLVKDSSSTLSALINRVYILVGVFMLFKLSFSVIHYIIDPDLFSDKAKGFTNLVKKVIIAVVLLIFVPLIFEKGYELQKVILEKNVIPNLLMGTGDTTRAEDLESSARDLQFTLFGAFFTIDHTDPSFSSCSPNATYPLANVIGSRDMVNVRNGECLQAFSDGIKEDDVSSYNVVLEDYFKTADTSDSDKYDIGDERRFDSFYALVNWKTETGSYVINYLPLATIICGGYLAFLFLSFCIDIAGRAIRLIFMEILSPIAILSSIDPTSSNQDEKLKEWGKECLKIYSSLFLRLAVIYCAVQLVKIITEAVTAQNSDLYYGNLDSGSTMNILVYIFLILGAFQVAKKLPELIEKALGIKLSGDLSLNPFKSLGENAGFMALTGGAAGLAAGGAAGALAAYTTARNHDHGVFRSLVSGAGGVLTGGLTGAFRGGKAKGLKGFNSGLQSGGRIARRMEVREATGGIKGLKGMMVDRSRNVAGAPTTYESLENKAKRYDDVKAAADKMKERATSELSKKSAAWKKIQAERILADEKLKNANAAAREMKVKAAEAKAKGDTAMGAKLDAEAARLESAAQSAAAIHAQEQKRFHDAEEAEIKKYIDSKGTILGSRDEQLEAYRGSLKKAADDAKVELENINDWDKISADSKLSETEAIKIRATKEYNDAKDRHEAIHSAMSDAHKKH